MLDVALSFLVKNLNAYMMLRTGTSFGEAELGRVVDEAGKCAIKPDHVGVSLVNIEEDRIFRSQMPDLTHENGKIVTYEPPLKLNLNVLFVANFQQYDQALRHLSIVLSYFQAHPVFARAAYPGMDSRIERLSVELQSLSFEQLNQIWAFIGGKQILSAMYKVRVVTLQDREPTGVGAPVSALQLGTVAP